MKSKHNIPAFLFIVFASCMNPFHKTIHGDGNITTTTRNAQVIHSIKCEGSYNVQLTQGSPSSIKITTDDNLQSYILTDFNGDELDIHSQKDINVDPSQKTQVQITTDKLEDFQLSGSGNVTSQNKFTGGDHLNLGVAGSGDIHFSVNTPVISSDISGSGNIFIDGETKNEKIEIAGTGNYHAENLMAENATVKIAGTGDAYVYADSTLNIDIAGVGNVNYKGNPSITQSIAGTGKIKKMD